MTTAWIQMPGTAIYCRQVTVLWQWLLQVLQWPSLDEGGMRPPEWARTGAPSPSCDCRLVPGPSQANLQNINGNNWPVFRCMEQGAAAPKLTATNIILGIIQVSFLQRYFNAGGCRSDKYGRECALFGPKISRTMTSPAPLLQCCTLQADTAPHPAACSPRCRALGWFITWKIQTCKNVELSWQPHKEDHLIILLQLPGPP